MSIGIVRASHDSCNNAERRCGARDGGAGWVGPPATRHRLCVLLQIGDKLVAGVEQFLLVDDVVAVEDGAALVAGQEHGDPLGDAGADQVAGGGAAAIVEEAGRHPGRLAGGAPRRAPAPDGDAVAVEDERAVGVAACPPSVQRVGEGGRDGENPPHQGLRAGGREPDDAAGLVDFVPGEAEDLVLAPAGVVGEVEDVLPRGGQVGADGEVFGVLEEALAGGILPQTIGEAGHGVEPAPVDGEGAHAVEGRGLAIDGAGGRPGGAPGELVLADLIRGQRGGPRLAAEERGEMGDPAAGGALGPELPDLVVLEVGVAELAQGWPLGAERARGRRRRAGCTGGAGRAGVVRGHGRGPSCVAAAGGRASGHPRSGGRDREAECVAGATGRRDDRRGTIDLVHADRLVPPGEGLPLVLDSTGLSIVGAGEWAAAKHGGRGRRGWRKLHLGVDQSGVILVHTLTEATGDDATTALDLLTAVEGPLVRVTADAAYDTVAVYETAGARGATVVIPPAKTATVSGHGQRSPARDRTITLVKTLGRRRWKKASGYHRQGRVENAFFRYKSIIGDGLRARRALSS